MTLSEYVKKKQNEGKAITLTSIANDVPCTRSYIAQIARGEKIPSYPMAKRIEHVTNGEVNSSQWYKQ